MMVQQPHVKIGSYQTYLLYKRVIDIIRIKPCSRMDVAKILDIDVSNTWYVMRVLVKAGVIKICSYDMSTGHKRGVYELIKDE